MNIFANPTNTYCSTLILGSNLFSRIVAGLIFLLTPFLMITLSSNSIHHLFGFFIVSMYVACISSITIREILSKPLSFLLPLHDTGLRRNTVLIGIITNIILASWCALLIPGTLPIKLGALCSIFSMGLITYLVTSRAIIKTHNAGWCFFILAITLYLQNMPNFKIYFNAIMTGILSNPLLLLACCILFIIWYWKTFENKNFLRSIVDRPYSGFGSMKMSEQFEHKQAVRAYRDKNLSLVSTSHNITWRTNNPIYLTTQFYNLQRATGFNLSPILKPLYFIFFFAVIIAATYLNSLQFLLIPLCISFIFFNSGKNQHYCSPLLPVSRAGLAHRWLILSFMNILIIALVALGSWLLLYNSPFLEYFSLNRELSLSYILLPFVFLPLFGSVTLACNLILKNTEILAFFLSYVVGMVFYNVANSFFETIPMSSLLLFFIAFSIIYTGIVNWKFNKTDIS